MAFPIVSIESLVAFNLYNGYGELENRDFAVPHFGAMGRTRKSTNATFDKNSIW